VVQARAPGDDLIPGDRGDVIDLYCERVAPGPWGEPLNVLSSLGYLVTGWLLLATLRRRDVDRQVYALATLPIAIAAGSVLFHVVATPWARRLDEAPILAFQLLFVWMYCRRQLQWTVWGAAGGMVLLVLAVGAGRLVDWMNGSAPYLPSLAVAAVIGVRHRNLSGRLDLFVVFLLFSLGVAFRSLDNAACATVPVGTHFIWHLLTAFVIYAFAQAVSES
jgi:hypothetical protein